MSSRRMFSLKIINSARFLKMPQDAQNLYFHLVMRADDDGIVEAYTVMRLVGSSEDSLKILHAKEFVYILNEDLVTYLPDWLEHNKLRSDRITNSIYRDLLVRILPEAKLLEPRHRTDVTKKQNMDGQWTDNGQTMDGQWTDNGQPMDRLSKVKLSKVNIKDQKPLPAKKFADDRIELILAQELLSLIEKNNPNVKSPNIQKWAEHIDYMIRLDKRDVNEIRLIIDWTQKDSFWKCNILSTEKLRKNFDALWMKVKGAPKIPQQQVHDKRDTRSFEQRQYSDEFYNSLYNNSDGKINSS